MWGAWLAIGLVAGGVALLLLGLAAQDAANADEAAAFFVWFPRSDATPTAFEHTTGLTFAMDAPELVSFYLWNVTNAVALLSSAATQPELQQLGPYVYEKRSRKRNVRFSPSTDTRFDPDNYGVVHYEVASTFHFSHERSNGSDTDHVVTLNTTYVRRLTKLRAQQALSERFLAAEFAHQHIRDYTRHLQTQVLADAKIRALRALLPELVTGARREGLGAVVARQQRRVADAGLAQPLVRMLALTRTARIPAVLRDVYLDTVDVALPSLLASQLAQARRQTVPRVLSNLHARLLVEAPPTLLGRQIEAQQTRHVPRSLASMDRRLPRLAFPYVLLEVFERASLEAVPFLLRAIKLEIVARDMEDNQRSADDAQRAVVELWRLRGSTSTDLDGWIDDSPTGEARVGFELLPTSASLQLSLEVATLLLGSRPSNLRFSLVDYDAIQTAAEGLAGPQSTPEGFAIWKQVIAMDEEAIAIVLDGVNEDVALESDYLTREQLLAVREYLVGWAQGDIARRDRQRFWRRAFARRATSSDVDDPDVDLDAEKLGVQTGFSLQPLTPTPTATPVSVAVAQQLWDPTDVFAFVHPQGFSKWVDVLDGVASATSVLLAGIPGLTEAEVTVVTAWIKGLLSDGFVRRRALRHWSDGTCLSVLQRPRTDGCLRYDLEPNVNGQQLGFEMNPEADAAVGAGLSLDAREALWNVTDASVSFLVPVHPSNVIHGYGRWLQAIRTDNFARLLGDLDPLTVLGITETSARAVAGWLKSWATNNLNELNVRYWWLSSTCWPHEEIGRASETTLVSAGQASCTESYDEQELTTVSKATSELSPFATDVKTFEVTKDECSVDSSAPVGSQHILTRTTYVLTARVFSCDVVSTGLADDQDDATTGFELMPLEQNAAGRIGLATAVVLWDPDKVVSFRNAQGYERWIRLATSIRDDDASATADIQALASDINAEVALICQSGVGGGGASSALFNASLEATNCVDISSTQTSRVAAWVGEQSGSAWVRNTLLDQWRRGTAGEFDIEPYRDGSQSGLELSTGCEVTLSRLTPTECSTLTSDSGTQYEVPRQALELWDATHDASFLTNHGFVLWEELAEATESDDDNRVAAARQALAELSGSAGIVASWKVWMEHVFQWLQRWKSNEHLGRDVLGHWLHASCPTEPKIVEVLSDSGPQSTTESSCTESYAAVLGDTVAELQQLASRPTEFFDADVVESAALVKPTKTVEVSETWVRCDTVADASFTRSVITRRSRKTYQACNLLSVLATEGTDAELTPPDMMPMDAPFELNGSISAGISLVAAQTLWDHDSTFNFIRSESFFDKWYPVVGHSDALGDLQDALNAFVGGSSPSDLTEALRYLKMWESSDAAADIVVSAWLTTGAPTVDVDLQTDGDQRGFEIFRSASWRESSRSIPVLTLSQAKVLWDPDSTYSLVRKDVDMDTSVLPTGFQAWKEIYDGEDWSSEMLVKQYPLRSEVEHSTSMAYTRSAQQRTELLAAMEAATTLSEAQLRGVARWLLNWAANDALLDSVLEQWTTGKTPRGVPDVSTDLATMLNELYAFPVASDGEQDRFTIASPVLANANKTSLRRLWDVQSTGALVNPANTVVWCMVGVTDGGEQMPPCTHLLDGYGVLFDDAIADFLAVVQQAVPDETIDPATADLSALALHFLEQELSLTTKELLSIAHWWRKIPTTSLFFQVYQLEEWSATRTEASIDPLRFGYDLAFVLPWNEPVARNASIVDLVANTVDANDSGEESTLSECGRSLPLLHTLWDTANPVSFLNQEGVTNWLKYIRGEIDEIALMGGLSAENPTTKVVADMQLTDATVSCQLQAVAHWFKSWSSHPSVGLYAEELWVSPITQTPSVAAMLMPVDASDMTKTFPLAPSSADSSFDADDVLFNSSEWWAAASRILLDGKERASLVNATEGFAIWQALLTSCHSANQRTGKCEPLGTSDEYDSSQQVAVKALQVLSQWLQTRVTDVSTALAGISEDILLLHTSSMIETHIIPWMNTLLDHEVLQQYLLEHVHQVGGDGADSSITDVATSFSDLPAVQFVSGGLTKANYTVWDSSSGDILLDDQGAMSERFPRKESVFNAVDGVVVRANSRFSPGFGELAAFCAESAADRRFAYDEEVTCSLGKDYTFSIAEVHALWAAFGFQDSTEWTWPAPNGSTWASESGVPPPSALPATTKTALLLNAFLEQPFESIKACKARVMNLIQAYDTDWSVEEKAGLCGEQAEATGAAPGEIYLRLPPLAAFESKPVQFVQDMQAYLRYAATKFGYESSVLGLTALPPQDTNLETPLTYPLGGFLANLRVSQVLFGSSLTESNATPKSMPLWANATTTERGASGFDFAIVLEKDSALYRKRKSVVGQLLAIDNRTTMNAWGEDVPLSIVRVTDGSQFTTAILTGQGENTVNPSEFPPEQLFFYWPYARRVVQIERGANLTRFGVPLMRYYIPHWDSPTSLPTGILENPTTPLIDDSLNMSFLYDDLPVVLQQSSSPDSLESVLDVDPITGVVLHRRFVWQLATQVGGVDGTEMLDIWHNSLGSQWLPMLWVQEEATISSSASAKLADLAILTPSELGTVAIIAGAVVIALGCVLACVQFQRVRVMRLQHFHSVAPEEAVPLSSGSSDPVGKDGKDGKDGKNLSNVEDHSVVDDDGDAREEAEQLLSPHSAEAVQASVDQTEAVEDALDTQEGGAESPARTWLHQAPA